MDEEATGEKEATNEGQRRLRLLPDTNQAIADQLNVTRPIVSFWRAGKNKPGRDTRRLIYIRFGIHPTSWDALPGTPAPVANATSSGSPDHDVANMSIRDLLDRRIVHWGKMVDSADETIGPDARIRAGDLERKCISERRALEREQRAHEPDAATAHPSWARIYACSLEALEAYPDALAAFVEALADVAPTALAPNPNPTTKETAE